MILSSEEEEWVYSSAKDLGFLEAKVIPLTNDPNYPVYQNWVDKGFHQPLEYLNRNNQFRENPKLLGEDLNSAFVFIHPYPIEFESKWVARYAWGKDYHSTMKAKLFELAENFQNKFNSLKEHRVCVDTAPILERSLAQQSGLGWIAKNGCLIHREHGSFFMIGCWLTSFKVHKKQTPASFHCGTCTRCLDQCPTDAFIQPGLLDAQKCLSTVTIENRNHIDQKFIPHLNEQVFGCDICQEVCPWNRKHHYNIENEYLPHLEELLRMPEQNFRDYFRKTAMDRPGWVGLRRNFLVAAAHQEDISNQLFIDHLDHPKDTIKITAQNILNWRKDK